MKACAECRYWDAFILEEDEPDDYEDVLEGSCRRYAPSPAPVDTDWPITHAGDWCGEFAPMPSLHVVPESEPEEDPAA